MLTEHLLACWPLQHRHMLDTVTLVTKEPGAGVTGPVMLVTSCVTGASTGSLLL